MNFKITSCILLGSNDKIDIDWKKEYLGQNLYLVAIAIKVDEPRTRNILRPYRRDNSQHQEFELNQPTSTSPLHVPSIGNVLVILRGPTSQYIFDRSTILALCHPTSSTRRPYPDLLTLMHIHLSIYVHMIQSGARHIVTSTCTSLT